MNIGTSNFLNASRWIAAFFVVFGHTYYISMEKYDSDTNPELFWHGLHFMSGFGRIAVVVFFVISGFLVGGRSIVDFRSQGFRAKNYFITRFSRIYTVFIPALIIGCAIDWVGVFFFNKSRIYTHPDNFYTNTFGNNIAEHINLHVFLGNLMQLQTIAVSSLGSNGPLWSLANEWWYYVLFGLCMIAYRSGRFLNRVVASGVIVAMVMVLPSTISLWFTIWVIGAGVAVLDRYWGGWPFFIGVTILVVCLIAVRCANAWLMNIGASKVTADFCMDLAVALGYSISLVCAKNLKRPQIFEPLHRLLASFSYTVYLVHFPAMVFAAAFMKDVFDLSYGLQQNFLAMIYLGSLLAVLYGYAWIFSALTEAHTHTIRARLNLFISDLLYRVSLLSPRGLRRAHLFTK